jgi:mono/diheme cytochrome c family protein
MRSASHCAVAVSVCWTPPAQVDLNDPDLPLFDKAASVLSARCGTCHGEALPELCGVCDGMYDIGNLGKMIESGKLEPCRWTDSLIYRRIAKGEMPPPYSGLPPVPARELDVVGSFVDGLCGELAESPALSGERTSIEGWLADDCGGCHGADAGTAPALPLDIPELLDRRLLVPCDPLGSVLLQRLSDNSMRPPGANTPPPTTPQIAARSALHERPCQR